MDRITMSASAVMSRAAREGLGVQTMALLGEEDEADNQYVEIGRLLRRGDEDDRTHAGYDLRTFQLEPGLVEVRATTLLGELFLSLLAAGG